MTRHSFLETFQQIVQKLEEIEIPYMVVGSFASIVEFSPGFELFIASAEDVIIKKLEYFKEGGSQKHIQDIQSILVYEDLDQEYLNSWIKRLGLQEQWSICVEA